MLLNSFFYANPIPFVPNTKLVDLSGADLFESNIVFPAGNYNIELQAGSPVGDTSSGYGYTSVSGKISLDFTIEEKFIVRAYCGSKASSRTVAGTNPYAGAFKVNGLNTWGSAVPSVSHMFGNAGSVCRSVSGSGNTYHPSSGNCLGDGNKTAGYVGNGTGSTGAGSCLHLLPVDGVFGTDFLRCFHATSGTVGYYASGLNLIEMSGSGSCYGGAGSGSSNNYTTDSASYAGGSTPFGTGGAGVPIPGSNPSTSVGNNGTGIGAGNGGGRIVNTFRSPGAACYFNGTDWINSGTYAASGSDGKIVLTFLGGL